MGGAMILTSIDERKPQMTRRTSKRRWLLIAVCTLFSITTLNLSNTNPADAADLCKSCGLQCLNEANYIRQECWQNGGTSTQCNAEAGQHTDSCVAVFCNYGMGCKL